MTVSTERPSWHRYFMLLAEAAATRSTCPRLAVGCVIVDAEKVVLSTGYNGALAGNRHCTEVGCDLDPQDHCQRARHAEANAVALAARRGTALVGAVAYVTAYPCWNCYCLLWQAGVRVVYYRDGYRRDSRIEALQHVVGMVQTVAVQDAC
jgi:dCMP deaminase